MNPPEFFSAGTGGKFPGRSNTDLWRGYAASFCLFLFLFAPTHFPVNQGSGPIRLLLNLSRLVMRT